MLALNPLYGFEILIFLPSLPKRCYYKSVQIFCLSHYQYEEQKENETNKVCVKKTKHDYELGKKCRAQAYANMYLNRSMVHTSKDLQERASTTHRMLL